MPDPTCPEPVFEHADHSTTGSARILCLRALVDLDLASEDRARAELLAACTQIGPVRWVVVFLGEHVFVDVRGLSALLDARLAADGAGLGLAVVAPPRCLRLMVDVLGAGGQLLLADSPWHAVQLIHHPHAG